MRHTTISPDPTPAHARSTPGSARTIAESRSSVRPPSLHADPIPVCFRQGLLHAFLSLAVDKDAKPNVTREHIDLPNDLPNDLCNGLIFIRMLNLPAHNPTATTSALAPTSKPGVVHVVIAREADKHITIAAARYTVTRYLLAIELGGIAGVVAPLIGKQSANMHFWNTGGDVPVLIRQEGQFLKRGPIGRVEQILPIFPTP